MSRSSKTVVVVTEGANPGLLDRWCVAGLLPRFAQLRAQGCQGVMMSEGTPYEPPGLTSLLTGRSAGDHGIFSYWNVHDPGYNPQTLSGIERRHPLMWHLPEFEGLRFACIGLFGAHPVEPLNGSLISYPMTPTLRACHPHDLQRNLARHGVRPVHDVSIFHTGQSREDLAPRFREADIERGRAAVTMIPDHDVVIVNLTAIDRSSHFYWQELELGPDAELDSAILAAYQVADAVIGDVLDAADDRTTVLAFSEIGFGPLRAYRSINEVLAKAGFTKMSEGGRPDYSHSQAFEAVQGTHGINLNLRDRYKNGVVAPTDFDAVRTEVADALMAAINPSTGRPYFSTVLPREDVYTGEAVSQAPDLLLEPADWRYLPLGDPLWASHVNRHWQSGWHRRESFWAAAGPDIPPGSTSERVAAPVDV
ncbi:MAG: alkaline phosphatase family protein, partial [Dietzia sp.]|nr:alkaline phosphatase family protein [Dietzia sp.]